MSIVGKDVPHDCAPGHVSGQSIYIDDIPPQKGELVVDFFWSPVAHGRIRSLDLSEAKKVEGVVGLYTAKDLGGHNNFGPIIADEALLVEELCEFIGHPIVVIAAETRVAARLAKQAIKCDIEKLTPVFAIDDAIAKKQFLGMPRLIKRGELEVGFKQAKHILEGTWYNNGQDHFYLESQAAIAYPGEANQVVVHSSTQHPTEVQEVIAHVLGLHMNQVIVITKRMGGGFGGKESQATHPAVMAALVALKTKRPARIIYGKDDDMQVTGKRHPFQNQWKVGFTDDGVITALDAHLYSDGGAFADLSTAVMARAMTHIDNAYYIPHVEVRGTVCKTNYPPNTAFRGFGGPQGIATMEHILQEISMYLGKDAYDVRRANVYGTSDRNVTPYNQLIFHNTLPVIYDELVVSSDYKKRLKAVEEFNKQSKTHLKGIAFTGVKFGISFNTKFLNQASALVNIYLDGTIQVSTGATEMGQGVNTNIRQLVAGEFDLALDKVLVMATSTEKNNNTSATAASSATDLNGSAAVNACHIIKARLKEFAAEYLSAKELDLERAPASVVFEAGFVYDERRPEHKITWKELVTAAYRNRVSMGERGFYATQGIDWSWESGPEKLASGHPFLYFTTGGAVAEVLIDRFTGDLKVERVDILMDIGRPINPGIARGQLTGAFIQGMGWVTTEELVYKEDGWLLSHSPTTYKIPNIQDTPAVFNVNWIDFENPANVQVKGSKAVGEPPLCLGLAVWNAVKHALSCVSKEAAQSLRLPATNQQIVMALALADGESSVSHGPGKKPALAHKDKK
jgi:xanthine dehydrogenase large subunit